VFSDFFTRELDFDESVHWVPDKKVSEYKPYGVEKSLREWAVLNGKHIALEDFDRISPPPGSDLSFGYVPGGQNPGFRSQLLDTITRRRLRGGKAAAAAFVLSGFTGPLGIVIGFQLLLPRSPESPREGDNFSFDDIQTRVGAGTAVPVAYGEIAQGGTYINTFKTSAIDGSGKTVLHALIALSSGPIANIAGLAEDANELTGDDIPDGILINGVEANTIPGIAISTRRGSPTQEVIGGFEDTTVNISVNQQCFVGQPVLYKTDTQIDAFSVFLKWENGLIYFGSSKIHAVNIQARIRWQEIASPSADPNPDDWEEETLTIEDKTTATFTREIRKDNLEQKYYAVEVTRFGGLDDGQPGSEGYNTDFKFDSINEIDYGDSLAYPNMALLALKGISSEHFSGGLPDVKTKGQWKLVYAWDGASVSSPVFNLIWSDNPAWIALDILLNIRTGAGAYLDLCDIDLQSFGDWADYCDELIDIGDGASTLGKRFTYNRVYDEQSTVWDSVLEVGRACRGIFIKVGNVIKVKIDQDETPTQIISAGNTIKDSFELITTSISDQPNHFTVQYLNAALDWELDTVTAFESTLGILYRPSTLQLPGITKQYQATRQAQFFLNLAQTNRRVVKLSMPIDSLAAEPGDVVSIQNDIPDWDEGKGGLIFEDAVAGDKIKLDKEVTIPAVGNLFITVRTDDSQDTFQTRTFLTAAGTYPAGTELQVDSAWDAGDEPEKGDVWQVSEQSTSGFAGRLYRLVSGRFKEDFTMDLEFVEHNASVYSDDPGVIDSQDPGDPPNPFAPPPDVTGLTLKEFDTVQPDGAVAIQIIASWIKPAHVGPYKNRVYMKITSDPLTIGTFDFVGETTETQFVIPSDFVEINETFEIAVCSVNLDGTGGKAISSCPSSTITITGSDAKPPDVTGFAVAQNGANLDFVWNDVGISNLAGYEIRRGTTWQGGQVIGQDIQGTTFSSSQYTPDVLNTFLIKAKNNIGNYSVNATQVTITPEFPPGTVDIDQNEDPTWSGEKVLMTVQPGGTLKQDDSDTLSWDDTITQSLTWQDSIDQGIRWDQGSGRYTTAAIDAGSIDDRLIQISIDTKQFDASYTWQRTIDDSITWADSITQEITWAGVLTDSTDVTYQIQIAFSDTDTDPDNFVDFVPGEYSFRYLKVRVIVTSSDSNIRGVLETLRIVATTV
jgi:predicted phage tail protein